MKKKSVAGIIALNFFKTIGIILLLVAVGVLSYYLTMLYFDQTARTERSTTYKHVITVNTGNESSNLIYSYDAKSRKIKAMVLELFDSVSGNMNYITIPVNTQITITANTYADLMKVSQKLPQVCRMTDINDYFKGDVAYEYGILILQEELKADIGYFTAISSDKFGSYFENAGSKSKPKYKPAKALLDRASACSSPGDLEDLMEEAWEDLITDVTLSQKQGYGDALMKVQQDKIRLYRAYGTKNGDVYTLNSEKNRKLINRIWESQSYTESQGGGSKTAGSSPSPASGRLIQITNGSGIDGLAAAYRTKLEADSLQIKGLGNYTGQKQTQTIIYAKKKKWGQELKKYFPSATVVERADLTNGADVEVLLGTDARLP